MRNHLTGPFNLWWRIPNFWVIGINLAAWPPRPIISTQKSGLFLLRTNIVSDHTWNQDDWDDIIARQGISDNEISIVQPARKKIYQWAPPFLRKSIPIKIKICQDYHIPIL
jgi:hypothetical protein